MGHVLAGRILREDRVVEGHLEVEDGRVVRWGRGEVEEATARGWIVPRPVNAHTHVADAFLHGHEGMPTSVGELVGPGGWKHRQLARADPARQEEGVRRLVDQMAAMGTSHFVDFREGGVEGVRALRRWTADGPVEAVALGRPRQGGFDGTEAQELLDVSDGIGLSGLRDHPRRVLESWSDAAHDANKPFAVHVSEDRRDDLDAALALDPAFVVHMVHATTEDLDDLADARVPIVVCPRSNAHFGLRPPVERMVEAGCTVAVGSDNGMLAGGNVLDDLALLHTRHPQVPLEELLRMTTHHGRRLLGLPAPSLERGAPIEWVVLPPDPLPMPPRRRPRLEPEEQA